MGVVCCLLVKGNRVECREMGRAVMRRRQCALVLHVLRSIIVLCNFVFATRAWLNERFWWGKGGGGALERQVKHVCFGLR